MSKRTPEHFSDTGFTQYIYECALRDRIGYLDAITSTFGEPCPEDLEQIEETKAEIAAIRIRRDAAAKRRKG